MIINTKIIIIRVIATAIDVEMIIIIIEIGGVITLKDKKIRISIKIKDLR